MPTSAAPSGVAPVAARARSPWVLRLVIAAFLVALGATLGVLAVGIWQRLRGPQDHTEFHVSQGVVVAVRDLARLEGAEYQVERVVSASDKQARVFGLIEAEDAILLVASGNIVAGVDLSGLSSSDFDIDEEKRAVTITLPSSTVFTSRLDNERTYIYRRDTDLLAERRDSLETKARQEAEKALLDAAKEEGIIRRSNESVRRTVESVVKSLGYRDVVVKFHDPIELGPK
jgi:hypothetical protein